MKRIFAGGTCMAAIVAFGMVAFAQSTGQTPAQPTAQPSSQAAEPRGQAAKEAMEQVTIVGCVQREADYRRARDAGRGGVAGTGVGVGNEYVLVNATRSSGATGTAGTTPEPGAPKAATGASATGTATGEAFELTGPNEGQVGQHVGKRVEIVGKLKPAETGPTGTTGGPTAGAPPRGVDVASRDLKLREVEVISVRETTGTCQMQR